jgi:hypothetical protein
MSVPNDVSVKERHKATPSTRGKDGMNGSMDARPGVRPVSVRDDREGKILETAPVIRPAGWTRKRLYASPVQ